MDFFWPITAHVPLSLSGFNSGLCTGRWRNMIQMSSNFRNIALTETLSISWVFHTTVGLFWFLYDTELMQHLRPVFILRLFCKCHGLVLVSTPKSLGYSVLPSGSGNESVLTWSHSDMVLVLTRSWSWLGFDRSSFAQIFSPFSCLAGGAFRPSTWPDCFSSCGATQKGTTNKTA